MDGYPRGFLHRPPYPCRYARADDAQLARGPGEVAAVAAQYEKRYTRHDQQEEEQDPSRASGLYKYDKHTRSVYLSAVDVHEPDRVRLEDVEEMQKKLNESAENIKKNIDCLSVKLQTIHRTIDYARPRRIYRDNLGLGIKPSRLRFF